MFRLLLIALMVLVGCSGGQETPVRIGARPAKLIEIQTTTDVREISLPAVIEARASAELSFRVEGYLEQVAVVEGDQVLQGHVIARLEQRDFKNQLVQARAQFENAKTEYARAERLIEDNAIARGVFDQRKTQRDVAEAALDSAKKALDNSVLRAPFDGVVSRIVTDPNQNVTARQTIVTLQSTGSSKAVIQVPATLMARQSEIEPLGNEISLDAAPDVRLPATFLKSDTQINPSTQTFQAELSFVPPPNLEIVPGMTGTVHSRVRLSHNGGPEKIFIPLGSIVSSGGMQYVWVVDTNTMKVTKQPIRITADVGDNVAVESGLEPGQTIVGAGAAYLHEGMEVRRFEQ